MIKKRSRFWTIVFAMLPGAGHMYNGFMKKGVSIMAVFFLLWFIASWLGIGPLALLTPVVWFYAFFDCVNMRFQDDEEFYMQEDDYLFDLAALSEFGRGNPAVRPVAGIALIVVGVYALWNNVAMHLMWRIFPNGLMNAISELNYIIPQIIIGALIIWIGVVLVRGKKQEVMDETEAESGGEPEKEAGREAEKEPVEFISNGDEE